MAAGIFLLRRVRHVAVWLTARAWVFWLGGVVPLALSIAFVYALPGTKLCLTLWAGVLQLGGLGVAFASLAGDAKAFGESLLKPFRNWWASRPWQRVEVRIAAAMGGLTASANVNATLDLLHDGSVGARLAVLESYVAALRTASVAQERALQELRTEAAALRNEERKARETAVKELESKIREHAVGGAHLNLLGVYWVLLGTVLSTYGAVWDVVHP